MTRNRHTQIGLDRLVRLKWLEKVSSLAQAGIDPSELKQVLQTDLLSAFRSTNTEVRGSIDKTITILRRVWLTVPSELEALRVEGLELLRCMPKNDQLTIHWGMVMAVYPFWSGVAMHVGRLLKLQGSVAPMQVQRRTREQYGERETVSRRTRYVLRSFVDWGVLRESEAGGNYLPGTTISIDNERMIAWLVEAVLHARETGMAPFQNLLDNPSLFPFRIKPVHTEGILAVNDRIDVLRHRLNEELVMLRSR